MIFLPAARAPNFIMCLYNVSLIHHPAKHGFNNQHIKYCSWQGKGSWLQSIQNLSNKNMWLLLAVSPSAVPALILVCNLLESTGQGAKKELMTHALLVALCVCEGECFSEDRWWVAVFKI